MAFQVSPGIKVTEQDLTAGARTVSVSDAAFAGPFKWGPALVVTNVDSEDALVQTFGKPDEDTFQHWFSAAAFLAYSNLLRVVRVTANGALNATAEAKAQSGTVFVEQGSATVTSNAGFSTATLYIGQKVVLNAVTFTIASITNTTQLVLTTNTAFSANIAAGTLSAYGVLVRNSDVYEDSYPTGTTGFGAWIAKYPGDLGNTLKVSVASSSNAFASTPANGSVSLTAGSNTVTGTSTNFDAELIVGDSIVVGGRAYPIYAITNSTQIVLTTAALATTSAAQGAWTRRWQYFNSFDRAPNTSSFVSSRGGSKDELHVVVVDEDGLFSGVPGTILERFAFASKAKETKNLNGDGNYYVDVINRQSKYIWWMEAPTANANNWGGTDYTVVFGGDVLPNNDSLVGGQTRNSVLADSDLQTGYDQFADKDSVDVSLVITGPASSTVAAYVIQNICEVRADCVAYVSPNKDAVVSNAGSEVADITTYRNALPSSSFGFMDSGWKYLYDKYNDKFRWVPLNGDMAGIAARSDSSADPWFSPAGFSRGIVKNVVKLAWNPTEAQRDDIYKIGVNPVVSFPSQGVMLYGDKTLLDRPSAFDRINVRRLFIILEKTIARLGRAQLFEFNDEFTRSQFRNTVEPYLRDVKARRGVTDYRVICDDTNNTAEVIEQNRFVGDIFIKPSRSINFIQLNFVAVRSGVSFQEVTGA